nr:MAG TPA: hypothetical protein [Caudoviricetes sp.]
MLSRCSTKASGLSWNLFPNSIIMRAARSVFVCFKRSNLFIFSTSL